MAKKIADSIRLKLSRLRKMLDSKPSKSATPKKKSTAPKAGAPRQQPPPPKEDRVAAQENSPGALEETPKKKVPAKPWYRHRQRW